MEKRAGVGEKSQRWSQNEAADGIRSGHGGRWLFEFSASRAFLTSSDARCSCRRFNRAQRGLLSRAWAGELSPPLMMCVNPRRPVRELLGRRGLRQSATVCRATRLIDALSSAQLHCHQTGYRRAASVPITMFSSPLSRRRLLLCLKHRLLAEAPRAHTFFPIPDPTLVPPSLRPQPCLPSAAANATTISRPIAPATYNEHFVPGELHI